MKKAILSIDGGGIRGIIPLCALIELERQLNVSARALFSFIAGTSTGAIIAAGLSSGIAARELLKIYQTMGPQVFVRNLPLFARTYGSYRYPIAPLRQVLTRFLGEATLNELPVETMITATRVTDGHPWYFVRDNALNSATTGHLKLVDCVTASSAAPTFFQPYYIPGIGNCVDGGVGVASNPIYQACVEAFMYSEGYVPEETRVVSLGCGFVNSSQQAPESLVQWVRWTVGELLNAPSQQQTQIVQRHFKTVATVRVNPQLPYRVGMDAVDSIPDLVKMGHDFALQLDWPKLLKM